jgi:hypothetical protein
MQIPRNLRQGNRSEYLAQFILSSLAITTQVPRQEDIQGVDFHCSVLRRVHGNLIPSIAFNIQIKSSSEEHVEFGGMTKGKTPRWKGHEISCLRDYQTPFFVGVVDKDDQRLDIYQTINRAFLHYRRFLPQILQLKFGAPNGRKHLRGLPEETTHDNPNYEPGTFDLYLGDPVVSINIAQSENPEQVERIKTALVPYIQLDQQNIALYGAGFRQFSWPLVIHTNQGFNEFGMSAAPQTPEILRIITPGLASLFSFYRHVEDFESIRQWESIIPLLPSDQELEFSKSIIDTARREAGIEI